MRLKEKRLRSIIREALGQHLRGNLDPQAGQMAALEASDPFKDYMMWVKTNGMNPIASSTVATYTKEKGLSADALEIQQISNNLRLGFDSANDIKRLM